MAEDVVLAKTKAILNDHAMTKVYRITNIIGFPDLLACVNGRFVGIEVKYDKNGTYGVTKAQEMRLRHIMNAGGVACVIDKDNVDGLESFLDRLCDPVNQSISYGM